MDRGGAYEAEQVQTPVSVLGVLEAREDLLVLVELPLLDRDVDPYDVLPYDAPRADIQMPVCSICGQGDGRGGERRFEKRADPTSEFPMSPSERPTASPCAASLRYACSLAMVSMFVVVPFSMALPFRPSSEATPQPSCTLLQYTIHQHDLRLSVRDEVVT